MKSILSGKKVFIFSGVVMTVLLVVMACNPTPPAATTTPPATMATGASPTLTITAPGAGASLPEGNVTVSIAVQSFELVAPGGANAAGKGHVHYYMDVTIPTTPGAPAVTGAGTYKATPETSAVWNNVKAGTHTFGVQVVNNNHTPLSPPVTATVTVTVGAAAPAATTTPPVTAAASPTLNITAPASGASLPEGSVTVSIAVQNFELVAPGGANAAGKGHAHYYLDVDIPTTAGAPAITGAGTYKATPETSAVWDSVKAGTHTLGVQVVNNNHTPLSPPVTAKITVTVTAAAATTTTPPATTATGASPTLTITSPPAGANVAAGSVTVTIAVQNFELVAPGGANAAGKGHIHYYKDVTIPTTPGAPATTAPGTYKATPGTSATWDGVTAGTHTFGVQLVNNDHSPLSPPVIATVTVTVSDTGGITY